MRKDKSESLTNRTVMVTTLLDAKEHTKCDLAEIQRALEQRAWSKVDQGHEADESSALQIA